MSLSQLPPDAQYRYRNMQDELEEAFNLIQSLQKRIKDTELIIGNFNEDQIAEAQPYIDDHTRQSQRIAAARAEHNALALVHTTVRTWIDMLNVNVRYEDVHMREYKLPKGVTYSQAIEEIRMQIDDLIGSRNRASTSVPRSKICTHCPMPMWIKRLTPMTMLCDLSSPTASPFSTIQIRATSRKTHGCFQSA